MTRPPLGDEQSRAAIVSDLDRNLLVEAGAGSGKTHMMAARMAAGIARGKYTGRAHGRRHVHAQGGVRAARPIPTRIGRPASQRPA